MGFGRRAGCGVGSWTKVVSAWTGLVALGLLTMATALSPTEAPAATKWLCKPGLHPNPCRGSLATTVTSSAGATRVTKPRNAARPKVDCFYVYPTVSEQPTTNANRHIDPQQIAIAEYQAARFSRVCRVYAPMYRQLTLAAISGGIDPQAAEIAYRDVRAAWRTYLRRHNHGRGVVLIGHSQGTGMLSQLLREEIERHRAQRRKLVSGVLLGGNVTVRKGSNKGGTFRRTPTCRKATQVRCVIAFSTFNERPPDDAAFGRSDAVFTDLGGIDPERLRVACTSPAKLDRSGGRLQTLSRSEPFPGTLGVGLTILYGGPAPTAATPWLTPRDHYTGRCVRRHEANVLMLSPVAGARTLNPSPTPAWGLHLVDVNIALGNLVRIVREQSRSYLRR